MAYELRDQQGSLFKNDRKTTEAQPHYTGKAMVNGVEMYVSAWLKESASGQKFFSLAFKNKDAGPAKDAPKPVDDLDEAIPF